MSMLAEHKRKQRWSLNPRGKQWAEDTNGFGQKMLQKMGWKHGKGLGANENGMVESLRVIYKNDSKGMGYKEVEEWTAHDDNFSSLLKNLNGNTEETTNKVTISSLEKKSENCRTRIHYHKFTKGKDLSRYSEKDLANIFGRKALKQTEQKDEGESKDNPKRSEATEEKSENLINKGSMADYFKKKLPNLYNKSDCIISSNAVLTKETSESENERVGFGFLSKKRKRGDEDTIPSICDLNGYKKNKKSSETNFVLYVSENSKATNSNEERITNDIEDEDIIEETVKHHKKKKKRKIDKCLDNEEKHEQSLLEDGSEANGDDLQVEAEKYVDDNNFITKRKKNKLENLMKENKTEVNEIEENDCDLQIETVENVDDKMFSKRKKKKSKKNKLENLIEENKTEINKIEENENDLQIETEENVNDKMFSKVKRKKSKKNKLENSIMKEDYIEIKCEEISVGDQNQKKKKNGVLENIDIPNPGKNDMLKVYEKQKKSKKKENNLGISNPAFNFSAGAFTNYLPVAEFEDSIPVKKKQKHVKTNEGIDNPLFNISTESISEPSPNPYEVPIKKKKKKSVRKEIGLDNPALNLNDVICDNDLMLNVVNTPVILKKDINSSIEKIRSAKRKSVRFNDVLQERIIPNDPSERINEYLTNRNELFDINTLVIEESVKEEMEKQGLVYENGFSPPKQEYSDQKDISRKVVESSVKEELNRGGNSCGFVNNGFDIRSVDKVNFYECKYEVKSPNNKGIDNKGFNKLKNQIEENVKTISNTIERYQAEVENDINESKVNRGSQNKFNSPSKVDDYLVGDVGTQISRSIKVEEGSKLSFKEMHFKTKVPIYLKRNLCNAKKTYRHLIRGDITVAFKNSNLHDIRGYAI